MSTSNQSNTSDDISNIHRECISNYNHIVRIINKLRLDYYRDSTKNSFILLIKLITNGVRKICIYITIERHVNRINSQETRKGNPNNQESMNYQRSIHIVSVHNRAKCNWIKNKIDSKLDKLTRKCQELGVVGSRLDSGFSTAKINKELKDVREMWMNNGRIPMIQWIQWQGIYGLLDSIQDLQLKIYRAEQDLQSQSRIFNVFIGYTLLIFLGMGLFWIFVKIINISYVFNVYIVIGYLLIVLARGLNALRNGRVSDQRDVQNWLVIGVLNAIIMGVFLSIIVSILGIDKSNTLKLMIGGMAGIGGGAIQLSWDKLILGLKDLLNKWRDRN